MLSFIKKMVLSVGMLTCFSGVAMAEYPDRPITLIVSFGAGGQIDVTARMLASMLEQKLGQSIVIQNIVGAGGTQGSAQLAAAKPDGYTFGYMPTGTMSLQPHVVKLPYDALTAFDYIGNVVRQPVTIMTPNNAPWKNVNEFIEMVKKNPNKYIAGITATGNMTHVPFLAFANHFGIKMRYIPYRSAPEIMKDMMAKRIHTYTDAPGLISQFDIYGLVQFADERVDGLDFPTAKELGMDASFSHWQGIIAPKGIPAEAMEKFSNALAEVVQSEEFQAEAIKLKTKAAWMSPEEFGKFYIDELNSYKEIIDNVMKK